MTDAKEAVLLRLRNARGEWVKDSELDHAALRELRMDGYPIERRKDPLNARRSQYRLPHKMEQGWEDKEWRCIRCGGRPLDFLTPSPHTMRIQFGTCRYHGKTLFSLRAVNE